MSPGQNLPASGYTVDGRTARALRHLRRVEPRLAEIIGRVGAFDPVLTPNPFQALIGSIVHQQVSVQAAATIYGRLKALCPRRRISPVAIQALRVEDLRGCGLSRQKAAYARNIADEFASRRITGAKLRRMTDEEVLARVTQIKGVGRWTAEMLLIFSLERPDVWPVDDLGLRKAVQRAWQLAEIPTPARVAELATPWRPYRTYATWYLWRSLEGPLNPAIAS